MKPQIIETVKIEEVILPDDETTLTPAKPDSVVQQSVLKNNFFDDGQVSEKDPKGKKA